MSGRVGLVVIGRNQGERLSACLTAATATGMPLVYADSASSDGSSARAAAAGATVVDLDPEQPMNASRGRREGAEQLLANHPQLEYVQFIDGDCLLQSGWIDRAVAFLDAHPRAAAVCGRRFEAFPHASFYNRLSDREWDTPIGEVSAVGGDALMRIEAYRAVGGFDPAILAGEEPELCTRMRKAGWTIHRIDVPMTEHDMAMTHLSQWLRRSRRGGRGYAQVWRATGGALYGRQLRSALLWMVVVPLAGIALALSVRSGWPLLFVPLAWLAQIVRLAARQGITRGNAWREAGLMMLTKGSEAIGASAYFITPGDGEGSELSFGLREAVILTLIASAIGCVSAWRALHG